jgi:hypothetical protein
MHYAKSRALLLLLKEVVVRVILLLVLMLQSGASPSSYPVVGANLATASSVYLVYRVKLDCKEGLQNL